MLNSHAELEQLVWERTSELNQEKEKAEQENLQKNHFVALLSHELRIPLNAIQGFNELLGSDFHGTLNAKPSTFRASVAAAENLLNMVNELIDISKIDTGIMALNTAKFNSIELLDHAKMIFQEKYAAKDIGLELEICQDTNKLLGDISKCNKIVSILLSNALKFTPEGGSVCFEIRRASDGYAQLSRRDTGPGLTKSEVKRIFSAFYKTDSLAVPIRKE